MAEFSGIYLLLSICAVITSCVGVEYQGYPSWSRSREPDIIDDQTSAVGGSNPAVRTYKPPFGGSKFEASRSEQKFSTMETSADVRTPSGNTGNGGDANYQKIWKHTKLDASKMIGCNSPGSSIHNHPSGHRQQETSIPLRHPKISPEAPMMNLPNIVLRFEVNLGGLWGQEMLRPNEILTGISSNQMHPHSAWNQPHIHQELNIGSLPYPMRAQQMGIHPGNHYHQENAQGPNIEEMNPLRSNVRPIRPRFTTPNAPIFRSRPTDASIRDLKSDSVINILANDL